MATATPELHYFREDGPVTEREWRRFKKLFMPNTDLTLEDLQENTNGAIATHKEMYEAFLLQQRLIAGESQEETTADEEEEQMVEGLSPCETCVGNVIIDAVFLVLGLLKFKEAWTAAQTAEKGENVAKAARPAINRIKQICHEIEHASSLLDKINGYIKILGAIYSAGCLGAVWKAMFGKLTTYHMMLYAITSISAIIAYAVAGESTEYGFLAMSLVTFAWLRQDVEKANRACR